MFHGAESFNQPVNKWDVSNVDNMFFLFSNSHSFNQSLNDWDVSNVTDMDAMFAFASSFNQPLNDWNVLTSGALSNVHDMFVEEATSFNHALHAPWYVVEQSESE